MLDVASRSARRSSPGSVEASRRDQVDLIIAATVFALAFAALIIELLKWRRIPSANELQRHSSHEEP
jgi:hypothetical protein